MPLVKIGSKHQVVIPKAVRDRLGVDPGDYVEFTFRRNQAVIKRKKSVDAFPVTDEPIGPKTRAAIRRGLKDFEEGRVSGPFESGEELIEHLHRAMGLKAKKA